MIEKLFQIPKTSGVHFSSSICWAYTQYVQSVLVILVRFFESKCQFRGNAQYVRDSMLPLLGTTIRLKTGQILAVSQYFWIPKHPCVFQGKGQQLAAPQAEGLSRSHDMMQLSGRVLHVGTAPFPREPWKLGHNSPTDLKSEREKAKSGGRVADSDRYRSRLDLMITSCTS